MEYVVGQPAELSVFYYPEALVLHPDDCSLLIQVLNSIPAHFKIEIAAEADDPKLDREPKWPLINIKTQRTGGKNIYTYT